MKKIITIVIVIITIIIIYLLTVDKKILYLNISDTENPYSVFIIDYLKNKNQLEKYINNFSNEDYRITSLINDINDNKSVYIKDKVQTLKNALVKSDLITISIGNTDLYYKFNSYDVNEMYEYIDNLLIDYDILLKLLRKTTKEKIIIFGYTTLSNENIEIINYYNDKLEQLCIKYKIEFINIDDKTKEKLKKDINSLLK